MLSEWFKKTIDLLSKIPPVVWITAILSFVSSLVLQIHKTRKEKKTERIRLYTQVYAEAVSVWEFISAREQKTKQRKLYFHKNDDLQKAVRECLNTYPNWQARLSKAYQFAPSYLRTDIQKSIFVHEVLREVSGFERQVSSIDLLFAPELSPVYYTDKDEVWTRVEKIIDCIGKNLSLFSDEVQRHWRDVKSHDPSEVKRKYETAIEMCEYYFEHNPRDFDPFYNILVRIGYEYGKLTQSKMDALRWAVYRLWRIATKPIDSIKFRKRSKP